MRRWSPIKPADPNSATAVPPPLTLESFRPLLRPAVLFASYAAWILFFRLVSLSCLTWFMSRGDALPSFGEIDEAFATNELTLMGVATLLYLLALWALHPILGTTRDELFSGKRFEKLFVPGFFHGALLSMGVVTVFVLTGQYRYFGVPIQAEESVLAIIAVLIRVAALTVLAYGEELIFRQKLWRRLRRVFPEAWAIGLTALAYCGLKMLQFDLGVMHVTSLLLLSVALSMRQLIDGDFVRGAGFWTGILVVFQPLLGLPVLGTEFSGVLLFKHSEPTMLVRMLSGGRGGPLSSLVFQFLLLLDVLRSWKRVREEREAHAERA